MHTSTSTGERPAVDERLVVPECGYEIIDGQVLAVSPAHEPHGSCHAKLAALLDAHLARGFRLAIDMLTRTSATSDFAPDASVYPAARDPATGGRQLEHLAFEVVSTESLGHAATKAARLVQRGVRRVFAIGVGSERVHEWSQVLDDWELLARGSSIEDSALGVALRVDGLVSTTQADDEIMRALVARGHPILAELEHRAELAGVARSIVAFLDARKLPLSAAQRTTILETRDRGTLERWLIAAATCSSVDALLT